MASFPLLFPVSSFIHDRAGNVREVHGAKRHPRGRTAFASRQVIGLGLIEFQGSSPASAFAADNLAIDAASPIAEIVDLPPKSRCETSSLAPAAGARGGGEGVGLQRVAPQ